MTDATEQDAGGPTRRRRPRGAPIAIAIAIVSVAAVAAGALVLREPAAPVHELTVAASPEATSVTGDAGGVDAAADVIRRAIDPTVPLEERATLFERAATGDPTVEAVLRSFDGLGERAGAQLTDVAVSARAIGSGVVVADVRVELDGTFGTRSTLRSIVAQLTDGEWRLSRETLCGLAAAAARVGAAAQCGSNPTVRYGSGRVGVATMLVPAAGEPIDPSDQVDLGYWNDLTAQTGGALWFVEYPQVTAGGGGGPVGPADLVRLDLATGAETARVRVSGAVTAMSAGDGLLWVLNTVYDPADGPSRTTLARIDAGTAQLTGELPMGGDAYGLLAADDAVWVYASGRLHRYAGDTPAATGSVDTGILMEPEGAALVGDELWVRRPDTPVFAIDRRDLSTREVAVPPGRLVGAAEHAWAVEAVANGSVARRLSRDGAVLSTVEIEGASDGAVWGDGAGGVWLTGSALASPSASGVGPGVVIDVVSRPFAAHLASNGAVSATWWAHDVGDFGAGFTPAGHGLGLSAAAGHTLLHR